MYSRPSIEPRARWASKSTFLRTVGVSAVLAPTIHHCRVEAESLLALVAASTDPSPHLFLLDELFRGTNAIERIAAGQAVLSELVAGGQRIRPHVVIAAT